MMQKPHEIIKKFYSRKKRANPSYSARSLARDLNLDPSFLSRILKGQKSLPSDRLPEFIKILEIDELGVKELKKSLIHEYAISLGYVEGVENENTNCNSNLSFLAPFEEYRIEEYSESLFHPWYKPLLLELVTLTPYAINLGKISQVLNVELTDLEIAWNFLVQHKYLVKNSEGNWVKSDLKIRFATKESLLTMRRFHKEIMARAIVEMNKNIDPKSFQNRFISSATLAVNPEHVPHLRLRLQEMILELVDQGTKGECRSVYALNFNFFPLIK